MELIEDYEETSAFTFFSEKTVEEIEKLIEEYGSDQDLIQYHLDKKYPEDRYFVLIDFFEDNNGWFRIRVWEK